MDLQPWFRRFGNWVEYLNSFTSWSSPPTTLAVVATAGVAVVATAALYFISKSPKPLRSGPLPFYCANSNPAHEFVFELLEYRGLLVY